MRWEEDEILDKVEKIFQCAIKHKIQQFELRHNLLKYLNTGGQMALDDIFSDLKNKYNEIEGIIGIKKTMRNIDQTYLVTIGYKKK